MNAKTSNTGQDLPPSMRKTAIRKADDDLHAKHERGEFDEGDPNHPKFNDGINYTQCFGMSWSELFAMQARRKGGAV